MKTLLILSMLMISATTQASQWEKTTCSAEDKKGQTWSFRVYHDLGDIAEKGQLSTTVSVAMPGGVEYLLGSNELSYGVMREAYLVQSQNKKFDLLYWADGRITGTYKINSNTELELKCSSTSEQSVQFLFENYFKKLGFKK